MPPLTNSAPWRIVDMRMTGERSMQLRFVDGAEGEVRFEPAFFRGVFSHLVDSRLFAEATIEMGAVTWPGELDLAPDRMHDDIVRDGVCVLGAN